MAAIFSLVAPFFGLIFIGYAAGRLVRLPAEALGWLNVFIIYVALPALFFRLIAKTPVSDLVRFDFILASLAATYSVFFLVFAAGRLLRGNSIAESTIQGLAGSYGNIGYMGPGLALLALGEKAAVPLALVFCFENALHFTMAPALMAIGGGDKRPVAVLSRDIATKILSHPFILATMAGILAATAGFEPPEAIARMIEFLAQAAAPCALFTMGVTLALRPLKRVPAEIYYIVPAKLLLLPLVMWLYLSVAGNFEPVWVYTALLLSALPTATNVFVISQQYGVWQERASASVLLTTIVSVLTVSGLLYLITSGLLAPDLFP